jgi:hypothetical protein
MNEEEFIIEFIFVIARSLNKNWFLKFFDQYSNTWYNLCNFCRKKYIFDLALDIKLKNRLMQGILDSWSEFLLCVSRIVAFIVNKI